MLYAFDLCGSAIPLLDVDKTGDDRWYVVHVPIADRLCGEQLNAPRKKGLHNG